jgi:hypothetical protein
VLLAINTDRAPRTAWTIVDAGLHRRGDRLTCRHSTDETQLGKAIEVQERPDGARVVLLTVPNAGFVIYE